MDDARRTHRQTPATLEQVRPHDDGPSLHGIRVLVIDDEFESLELAAATLRVFGAEVATAFTVRDGLDVLEDVRPDVVVCDLAMPGESGLVFIRRVRERESGTTRRLPVAAYTGFTGEIHVSVVFASGFDLHLSKPIEPVTFATAVAMLAGRCD